MSLQVYSLILAGLIVAPVFWLAHRLSRRWLAGADSLQHAMAVLAIAFALVAATGGLLGLSGFFSLAGFGAVALLAAVVGWLVKPLPGVAADNPTDAWPAAPGWVRFGGVLAATILAGAVGARLALPVVEYDALTYHLHFPAQWLHAARIFIIDTPYGDAAPAYAPSWGEVWFAWLMAPWRGPVADPSLFKLVGVDALAKVGQFPFLGLAVAALLWLARSLAGPTPRIYLPALLFCFVPWTIRQAGAPQVDLFMTSFFLAALAWSLDYRNTGKMSSAAMAGLSLGLAVGVKTVALAYAPLIAAPFLAFALARRDLRALGYWLPPLLAFGLPWFVRNWVVTGNPLYPLDVAAFGYRLFAGAYSRAAMMHSLFHTPRPAAALLVTLHAYGIWPAPLGLAGIVNGVLAARWHKSWRALAWLAPLALPWHFWFVPFNSQDRFLLWVVALSFLPLAAAPTRGPWAKILAAGSLMTIALTLIGPGTSFSIGLLPVHARGFLTGQGWLIALFVFVLIKSILFLGRRLKTGVLLPWFVAFAVGMFAVMAMVSPRSGAFVKTDRVALKELPLKGYSPIWGERPQVVAYAGRNRPYHLTGRGGLNRVVHINTDGCLECALHDYTRRLDAAGRLNRLEEKAPWRDREPKYESWREALGRAGVTMFFAETLSIFEQAYLWHDADGFSRERAWARQHPEVFQKLAATPDFELYRVKATD